MEMRRVGLLHLLLASTGENDNEETDGFSQLHIILLFTFYIYEDTGANCHMCLIAKKCQMTC